MGVRSLMPPGMQTIVILLLSFAFCSGSDLRGKSSLMGKHLDVSSHQTGNKSQPTFFDGFWLVYWGSVALVAFLIVFITRKGRKNPKENDESGSDAPEEKEPEELPRNMWALILVSAIKQARFESSGKEISPWFVVLVSLFMGTVQLTALFLMIHDLDPNADPYTVKPSTPFGSPWTVNSMKVIMTIFMVIALVSEAGQCNKVFSVGIQVNDDNFCVSRKIPLAMEFFQYIIAISVTWSGVAVILSFQSVPDIIYSSMSIMCISGVDEMFFECFDAVVGLDASFDVKQSELDEKYEKPFWLQAIMKFLLAFPMLLGVFVLARAWHTGAMPTDRVRPLLESFASTFA